MEPNAQQLSNLMDRVGHDARDFAAFKELARLFFEMGKQVPAQSLCRELFRHIPSDPELALLAKTVGVEGAPINGTLAKPAEQPPGEVLQRDQVLSFVQQADPTRDANLVAKVVGDYLDIHLTDEIVQSALLRFEMSHFQDLYQRCQQLHTHFRPRDFRLTCIVSTYASAAFIEECLDDLVAQSIFPDIEVLIIDAHSPQNEAERIRPYLDRYDNIRYLVTPHRIGIYPAWTMGSLFASAPYIAPFSANDRLLSTAYETLVNALDNHPKATLVYGDSYLTDKPHQTIGSHSPKGFYRWPDIDYGWLMLNCGVGPQPMWRKAVHAEIGYFDRRYKATGDQDFFLRHARLGGLLHVPELTGMAWITTDSLSGHPSALAEALNIHLKHFKSVESRIPLPARLEVWQIFARRFADLTTNLPPASCSQEVAELKARHGDYFAKAPT